MYKVLIVDDEKIVRLAIKSMVHWDNCSLEFVGSASNGQEALELCEKNKPDIIITDLKMPTMDGIEMIKRLKERQFDGEILVLSNYNDFELVREAMKYGVYDYILKITIGSDNFMKIMDEIVAKLNKKHRDLKPAGKSQEDLTDKRILMLKKLIEENDYVKFKDEGNLFNFGSGSCIQTYIVTGNSSKSGVNADFLCNELGNILSDLNINTDYLISFMIDKRSSLLLLHYQKQTKAEDMLEPQFTAERTKSLTKLYYNLDISIIYCKCAFDFSDFKKSLEKSISEMQLLFYKNYRDKNLLAEIDISVDDCRIKDMIPKITNNICDCIKKADKESFIHAFRQIIDYAKLTNLNPFILKKDIKKCLHIAEKRLINDDMQDDGLFDIYPDDTDVIFEALTDDVLLENLNIIAESAIVKINKGKKYRKEVAMSIDFIERHIASKITVSQIADHVNMTETYISKIFHSETGKSIVDYINYCKMKKAYRMLNDGNCLIKEAADAVGISDQFYFSRLFKKYYGINPSSIKSGNAIDK